MNLVSCNYASSSKNSFEAYRGFKPISSTSCECYDYFGMTCAARCVNYPVPGFEISIANGTGVVQATCPAGKKVLGCHIYPVYIIYKYDGWRKWYPSDDGSSCICTDAVLAECYATCGSGIKDYEIVSAYGVITNTIVSCKITGNVVLGCGQKADDASSFEKWTTMYIINQTSCLCYNYFGSTCYAICGKLCIDNVFVIKLYI